MKKICIVFCLMFLASCTSNTILKEPEDLIPKDTMRMLMKELWIASSSRYVKNKNREKDINYMPFVYERFKIDSARFQTSNLYYMSKIDVYLKLLEQGLNELKAEKTSLDKIKKVADSIRLDSLKKINKKKTLKPIKALEKEKIKN